MFDWIQDHTSLLAWMFAASLVTLAASVVILPILLARMPADYFVAPAPPDSWRRHHPILRFTLIVLKNVFGGVLIAAGIAMLVLPGQGLLTILMGLMLVDFPGKRRLELWIVKRRAIHRMIDWVRRRAHQPPLELPD